MSDVQISQPQSQLENTIIVSCSQKEDEPSAVKTNIENENSSSVVALKKEELEIPGTKIPKKLKKKQCQEEEAFQRINYLYQAGRVLLSTNKKHSVIAAYYGSMMTNVSKKSVLRIEPALKREICKGCCQILVPGTTARIRINKRPSPCTLWTCMLCQTRKRFHNRRGYQIWSENPKSVVMKK